MPAGIVGIEFPTKYQPWYIYVADLTTAAHTFLQGDIIVPNGSGLFSELAALPTVGTPVLPSGYAIALESFTTGMTQVQVAIPGSIVPFVADSSLLPCCLVFLTGTVAAQTVGIANAADLAGGIVLGRFHNDITTGFNELVVPAAADIVNVLTGSI